MSLPSRCTGGRWLIHALTLWGFLGLFVATVINYAMDAFGLKPTGTWVPLWYPVRLLGTISGLALMYGVTWFMINRWRKVSSAAQHSARRTGCSSPCCG